MSRTMEFCQLCDTRRWSDDPDRLYPGDEESPPRLKTCTGPHHWTSLEKMNEEDSKLGCLSIWTTRRIGSLEYVDLSRKIDPETIAIRISVNNESLLIQMGKLVCGLWTWKPFLHSSWRFSWLHIPPKLKIDGSIVDLGIIPWSPDMPVEALADATEELLTAAGCRYGRK